ncbi:hypothetical protein D3C75_1104290 [compost metagenome]
MHDLASHPATGQVIGNLKERVVNRGNDAWPVALVQYPFHLLCPIADHHGDPAYPGSHQGIDLPFYDSLPTDLDQALGGVRRIGKEPSSLSGA